MRRTGRRDNAEWVDIVPLGLDGLDYFTSPALLPPSALTVGENIRLSDLVLSRRKGGEIIYRASNPTGSKTFGTTGKYGTIPAASQLSLPAGGFALFFSITAVWAPSSKTGYILSSRVNGESFHVMSATISDAGVITVAWTQDSDDASVSVACDAVTNGSTAHVLALFDPVAGTFTVYINGAASGTAATGIAATEKPKASAATAWHVGAHYDPAVAGVVADTDFDGKVDGLTLLSTSGIDPTGGSNTLTRMLINHSYHQWSNPQMDAVVFCYDFDSSSTTAATDRTRYKNTMTLTGTPTVTAEVALASLPTNHVGTVQDPSGRRANIFANYGRIFYETIFAASS